MSAYQLKWAAAAAMVVDHVGILFFPSCAWFRIIGRISFPVLAFLIVEGVLHTGDIRCYAKRLGIFALFSEIPYDLAFSGTVLEWKDQNVFFTLLICVCLLWMIEWEQSGANKVLWCVFASWLAEFIRADYGFRGVVLVLLFYWFRERKAVKTVLSCAWMVVADVCLRNVWQRYAVIGVFLTWTYNGKEGRKRQKLFYCFYPVHLLILYILQKMI